MHIRALKTTGFVLAIFAGSVAYLGDHAVGQMFGFPGGGNSTTMVGEATYMVPAQQAMPMIAPAGYQAPGYPVMGQVQQVGCFSSGGCDSGCCDSGGCDGCGSCRTGCGGLLGEMCGGGKLNGLQNLCVFCRGDGCSVCQGAGGAAGALSGVLAGLAPYADAGLCSQRWYDIQAEVMALSMNGSARNQVVSRNGTTATAATLLTTRNVDFTGLAPGLRLTASMMFGAGGNIETTYFGFQHFSQAAQAFRVAPNGLTSAYSNFGNAPTGGFADIDGVNINRHRLRATSNIHSGEANYRRRWVGPYCRFQGSWLLGFRYFDLDDTLHFTTQGMNGAAPLFFSSLTRTRNALVGAQVGGDLWWNVQPGFHLGLGLKGAIFGNTAEQDTVIQSTSLGATRLTEFAQGSNTGLLGEIQARLVYRLSYSWSITSAYWFMGLDGVALGAGNLNTSTGATTQNLNQVFTRPVTVNMTDSITIHGFSVGAEYIW